MANKRELLRFLDQRVFDPIIEASADRHSQGDQRKLQDVQDRTRSEKDRFNHYGNAKEIVDNYKSDLHSSTAKRVNRELGQLSCRLCGRWKVEFLDLANR
jgi:hypothetical protein